MRKTTTPILFFALMFFTSIFFAQVSFAPIPDVCYALANPRILVTLTGGSPAGGVYSGPGVSGGNFDMVAAGGAGTYTITYTAIIGGIPQSATSTIKVNAPPAQNAVSIINTETGKLLTNGNSAANDPPCIRDFVTGGPNCASQNTGIMAQDLKCARTTDTLNWNYQINNPKPGITYEWGLYTITNNGLQDLSQTTPSYVSPQLNKHRIIGPTVGNNVTIRVDSSFSGGPNTWGCNLQDSSLFRQSYRIVLVKQTDQNGCYSLSGFSFATLIKPKVDFKADTVCLGQFTKFIGIGSHKVREYKWDFGDGATSTLKDPTHFFATPGDHEVTLIGTLFDCFNCGDTIKKIVHVINSTAPPITSCNSTVCGGSTVTYSTPPGCTFYDWKVNNGVVTSGQGTDAVNIEWSSVGPASIELNTSCTNSACPASKYSVPVLTNNINISGPNRICYQAFAFFSNSSVYSAPLFPGANYTWLVSGAGSGAIEDGQGTNSISVNWATIPAGTYQVSVVVSHPLLPCQATATMNVNIQNQFGFSVSPFQVCYNQVSTYTVNQPGQFKWSVQNGTVVSGDGTNSANILFNGIKGQQTQIWVKATGANNGIFCNDSVLAFPQIDTTAVIATGITGNQYVCPGSIEKYTAVTTNSNVTYNWTPVNGTVTSTSLNDVFITWGPAGPYGLSVTQTNTAAPNCTSSPFTLNVFDLTTSPPTIQGSVSGCINNKATYKVSKLAGASYAWTVSPPGIGSIIEGQGTDSITVQFTSAGAATISTSITLCPTPIVSNLNITVNPSPAAPTITQTGNVCKDGDGLGATLTATTGATTYTWSTFPVKTTNPINIQYEGTYTVTVTNSFGCATTGELLVKAKSNPNGELFTLDPIDICPLDPINVDFSAIQPAVGTYQWFKDGTQVSTNNKTYNATALGKYQFIVTSVYGCSKTSNEVTITNNGKCNCMPITSNYCKSTGKGTGGASGGVGASVNGSGFKNTINFGGGTSIFKIISGQENNPEILSTPDAVLCDGVGNFTSNTPGSILWYWDFGNGQTSTVQNPTVNFTPGYYRVTYYAMFADSSWDKKSTTIEVPFLLDLAPPNAVACNTLEFNNKTKWTVGAETSLGFTWDFGDGSPVSNDGAPTHFYSSVGTYTVTVTASNASCNKSLSFPVNILPDPQARFFPPTTCINSPIQLRDSSVLATGGTINKWLWSFGDGRTSNLQHPVYTFASAGTYNVTLTVTDQSGCTNTFTSPVTINAAPTGGVITVGGPTTFCAGNLTSLTAPVGTSYLWSTGTNQQTIIAGNTGKYSCTVTYANGCVEKLNPVTIIVNPAPPSTTTASNICGSGLGSVSVSWSNGSTYQWFLSGSPISGVTSQFYSTSIPGTYSVVVTGSNGCTSSGTATILAFPAATASITGLLTFCQGTSSTLTANVTGTAPFTYQWFGPTQGTGTSVVVSSSGTATLQVRDANNCFVSASVAITRNPKPKVNSFPSGCFEICYRDTFKSKLVGATNYQWYKDGLAIPPPTGTQPDQIITNDGIYKVVATSAAGCVDTTEDVNLVVKPLPTVNAGQDLAMCYAAGETVVLDGAGTGTYSWTPANALNNSTIATPIANPSATTNYILTVKDVNGCKNRDTMQVKVSCAQPVINVSSKNVCPGECAVLTASAGGGAVNYQYTWSTGQTGAGPHTICTVTSTTVGVTVTDNASNTDRDTAIITMLSPMVFQPAVSNLSCVISTGSALALASGSTAPYTYSWSTGSTVPSIFNVGAGTYTLTATDANGCKRDTTIQILQLGSIGTTFAPTAASCGINNGSIAISPTGGTAPYVYSWTNGTTSGTGSIAGTNSVISALTQGTYSLTITDASAGACSTTSIVSVANNLGQTSGLSITTAPACFGNTSGIVQLSISGGVPNYSYTWSDGTTASTGFTASSTVSFSNLGAGDYTVTVTDNNNCISTSFIQITTPPILVAFANQQIAASCGISDGVALASATGGNTTAYSYSWSNSNVGVTASALAVGVYTVTITDASGCIATSTAQITNVNAPVITTTTPVNISCNGKTDGSISIAVSGNNLTYSWSGGNSGATTSISGVGVGTYSVTVTDNNNCSVVTSATLTAPPALVPTIQQQAPASCGLNNGIASATVTGGSGSGYNYTWDNGSTSATYSNLSGGIYTVTITDGTGCSTTSTVSIQANPIPSITSITPTDILCNGSQTGSITVIAIGTGLTYTWSNGVTGSTTISGLIPIPYSVTVTDADGCTVISTVSITEPTPIVLTLTEQSPAICTSATGIGLANASGGNNSLYNYVWSNSATGNTALNLSAAIYTVTVTDGNNCVITNTVAITTSGGTTIAITPTGSILCYGGNTASADVVVTGGTGNYNYEWDNGSVAQTGTSVNANFSISNLTAGNYTITVTDNNNCISTISQSITQPPQVIVTANQQSNATCGNSNGVAIVNVNGGVVGNYTYQFGSTPSVNSSLNSESFTGLLAGIYTVTVSDNNGCLGTTSVTIQNSNPPNLTIQSTINTCTDKSEGSIVLDVSMGSMPYTYSWSDGVSTNSASNSATTYTIAGLIAANYTVSIIDVNGCVATATTTVALLPLPTVDAGNGGSVVEGNSLQLNGAGTGTGIVTYLWQPASYLNDPAIANPFTSPTQSITYTLMVTDGNGCTASDTLNIKYIGGCIGSDEDVFVANVFSPNGDGQNDILSIQGNGLINITWNIYDRWGNKIFEANEQNRSWDGTFNGKIMDTGTYVYYIKATCKKTLQEVILKGNVSIVK